MADDGYGPVRQEYGRLARRYDRRWARFVAASVRETLARVDLRPGDRVIDVGCGTGALLEALFSSGRSVGLAGVDLSPEMLEIAASRLGPAADLREGRAESLPFEDAAFDVVVSTNALHFFRRPEGALKEMGRVLMPGGRIVITDWCDDFLACRICDRVLRLVSPAHHHIYDSRRCRSLLEEAGFESVDVEGYRIDWPWGLMTARASKRAHGGMTAR
ncbi:MAG: class I SAM-dependent methyltransferase [Rhodospirillales bacterium]